MIDKYSLEQQEIIDNNLKEYYKKNIDVHINYLLFLNSFKSITTKGFLTAAPIIESIRSDAYNMIECTSTKTEKINQEIVELITRLLKEKDLEEVTSYIGYKLEEIDITNMSVGTYIYSKIIKNREQTSYYDETIRNLKMTHSINIDEFSSDLMSYFLESLRIEAKPNANIKNYINMVLSINENKNAIIGNKKEKIDSSIILEQLLSEEKITDIAALMNLFNTNKKELTDSSVIKKTLKNN